MADLVAHMAARLKEGADGKPQKFKQSNLVEFLSNFSDDQELRSLVTWARELLQGVEADDLRTAGDLRVRVRAGMSAISEELDDDAEVRGAEVSTV